VDYSGMSLGIHDVRKLKADLASWHDGVKVKTEAPFKSPWRTVQISDDAVGLLNSTDLILNLNEPNKLGDVSWVMPGKYIGIWWGMHLNIFTWGSGPNHGATTERTMDYMDFASKYSKDTKYGFDGVLVEGWNVGWDGKWWANGEDFNFTKPTLILISRR
jgi:alpha-glucosidase